MSDISLISRALADRYVIERELGQGGMATLAGRHHPADYPRGLCQLDGCWMIGARNGRRCSARRGRTPLKA